MPSIGAPELLVVIVLALIIFGPRRLPEIGRTVGKSMQEFRRAASQFRGELERDLDEEEPPSRPARPRPGRGEPREDGSASASSKEPVTGEDSTS